jgi:hypothetical protein
MSDDEAIAYARNSAMSADLRGDLWRQRFQHSPALQNEFHSLQAYAAYMNAAAQGRVRVFSGNTVVTARVLPEN